MTTTVNVWRFAPHTVSINASVCLYNKQGSFSSSPKWHPVSSFIHTEDTKTAFSRTAGLTTAVTVSKSRTMLPFETNTLFHKLHLIGYPWGENLFSLPPLEKSEHSLTRCIPMEVAMAGSISVPTSSMKGYSSCRWTITLAPLEDTRKGLYSSSFMYKMTCSPGKRKGYCGQRPVKHSLV